MITLKAIDQEQTSYLVKAYILNNITLEGYERPNTVLNLWEVFCNEYGYNVIRLGEHKAFTEWLKGMPSSFNIETEYYNVNQILKDIFKVETIEDDTINFEAYLNLIYINIKQLLEQ